MPLLLPVSVVMLHWKRPDNVRRITRTWQGAIAEGVVVTCPGATDLPDIPNVRLYRSSVDTLYSRFFAATGCQHECVIMQDDDIILAPELLQQLYECWRREPQRLHGFFGRTPRADMSYGNFVDKKEAEVPIILTRALAMQRQLAVETINCLPEFEDIQRDSVPHGNGEDIILSFVAQKRSSRLNFAHRPMAPIEELESSHPISAQADHFAHRTRVMRACYRWLTRDCPAQGFATDLSANYWIQRHARHGRDYVAHIGKRNYEAQYATIAPAVGRLLGTNRIYRSLDFGAGVGRFQELIWRVSLSVAAADLVPRALDELHFRFPGTEIIKITESKEIPARSGRFTLIWSCMVLQHIVGDAEFNAVCCELHRVAAAGALLLLVESASDSAPHVRRRTPETYASALGFRLLSSKRISIDAVGSHWFIAGRKMIA